MGDSNANNIGAINGGGGGFDFDFGTPAPQTQKPVEQNTGTFDFF